MRASAEAIKELLIADSGRAYLRRHSRHDIASYCGRARAYGAYVHNDEWVMLDKLSYMLHSPQRGDIIVFKYPKDPTQDYIKRVIGVAGDHVVVDNGHVYVNGRQLSESYIADPPDYSEAQCNYCDVQVPKGYLYVLGDNRDNSSDSHVWGFVPLGNVIGKAMFAYWPMPDVTLLH